MNKNYNKDLLNCPLGDNKREVVETFLGRVGIPLYIPLISVIASFLLIYKKEKKYNYLKKYIVFSFAFIILLFTEILLKFAGLSLIHFTLYFFTPVFLFIVLYFLLIRKMISERRI